MTIPSRTCTTPTHRASPPPPPTTPRSCTWPARAGPRARPSSPARGIGPPALLIYFTSTQGGGAAEAASLPLWSAATATGRVRSGPTTSSAARSPACSSSPGPLVLDLPDNITTSKHGTLVVCEDNVSDNFIRGLTRKGELFDIALNRLKSGTGTDRSRRVRRLHAQPRRQHPVREHPGQRRHELRHLGTLAQHRV